MEIRPIKTIADYKAALKEIETLFGAKKDSPEGDRLDVLATLVDAYEERRFPIEAPDPVEAIRFRMEQMGLTRMDLEPILGSQPPQPPVRKSDGEASSPETSSWTVSGYVR